MADLTAITKAARLDIEIQQGSVLSQPLDFGDTPIGQLNWRGQIRRTHADAQALAAFTFAILDGTKLVVGLSPTQTAALPTGNLVYDIEAHTENDTWVMRIFEGRVRVTPEVTRV